MNEKQKIIREHIKCTCLEAYKTRALVDPGCFLCNYDDTIEQIIDEYVEAKYPQRDSKSIIGFIKERFNQLKHKGYDWRSFYNGYLEGLMSTNRQPKKK